MHGHRSLVAARLRKRPGGANRAASVALSVCILVSIWSGRRASWRLQDKRVADFHHQPHALSSIDIGFTRTDLLSNDAAFFSFDDKDGRFCGKEGDMCRCFGHVRYGRLFSWSDYLVADGLLNCSAVAFGDPFPMDAKICKCFPTVCTTDAGTCTPEPCSCPTSWNPDVEWAKKTLMTSDNVKCWACEKTKATIGVAVDRNSSFCPNTPGTCTLNKSCKCQALADIKRVVRTKEGKRCWTCAVAGNTGMLGMDSGQKAMFWMLPILWPFMDFPASFWQVCNDCCALVVFLALCVVGYVLQNFVPPLNLNRFFSFYAPCMKKCELWRFLTYFMLHGDLQHLCINVMHLLDALDLEGVPHLDVSLGSPLKCSRRGHTASICYPDVGIGRFHIIMLMATVLSFGALIGTIKNFGAMVQGASSVCFGIDGALIALYSMFLGAGLDEHLNIPDFGAFFWMRIGIIAFHIVVDVIQSVFGGKDSVGTLAHMASFVAGFCYVILVLPPMGDGTLFTTSQPYIVGCGLTSPLYVTAEDASTDCVAFFRRSNGVRVESAQIIAVCVLGFGVTVSLVNAWRNRHISDDGIAVFQCGAVDGHPKKTNEQMPDEALLEERRRRVVALREDVAKLERLFANMPE